MLFYVRTLFFISIVFNAQALTPAQKASIDKTQETAKAYQVQAKIMQEQAVNIVKEQGNPLIAKQEQGECPIGNCGLTGSKVIQMKPAKDAVPYLMQRKKPVVFVSASMPVEALKHLGKQAKQIGAVLVIKGFVKGTLKATASLVDEINFPLEIDPKLFEKFNVQHVPTIMVHEKGEWYKVTGNVEIGFVTDLALKKAKGHVS